MAEDIIYGILSRLPIKSLARFQCVSKSWLKYINDPYLLTIHVKEEPQPIMFQLNPFYGVNRMIRISFLYGVQEELVLEMGYKDQSHGFLLLGSCNGLTLVSYEQDFRYSGTNRFAVINPTSKQRHDLPPISIKVDPGCLTYEDTASEAVGIGFDESTNTFKTVFLILNHPDGDALCALVHTSGTSSWREILETPPYLISSDIGVFSHGRLHWHAKKLSSLETEIGSKIVWFDVKTEEFGVMDPPPNKVNCTIDDESFELVDLNGEIGCDDISPICFKLWIWKHEEWVMHCSFDLGCILPQYERYDVHISGCWNKDGDILLNYNGGEKLFVFTLKTSDLREVELEHRDNPDWAYIQMYQSSLFSVLKSPYSVQN